MATQQHDLTPLAKWLFGGPGFAVIVLILSTILGFQVLMYSTEQQERRKLLMTRVTGLTAIHEEATENLARARRNVESLRKTIPQRGVYPGLIPYTLTAWNAVMTSEGIVTLSPKMFVTLGVVYGGLADANRDYATLQEHNLLSGLQVASASPEEYVARDRNRASILRSTLASADLLSRLTLPLMKKVVAAELESAKMELATVNRNVGRFRQTTAAVARVAAWILGAVAVLAFLEIFLAIGFAVRKGVQSGKTSEPDDD